MVSQLLLISWVGLVLGVLFAPLWLSRMPPPFDDVVTVDIPPERLVLFPGNANGSQIPPTFEGAFALNKRLQFATRLFEGMVVGSESVAVTPSGTLVMLDRYGYVHTAVSVKGQYQLQPAPLYIGPGRPLGFHMVGEDQLYVCDSLKGLMHLNFSSGVLQVLSNSIYAPQLPPRPLHYANDLDVARDGTIYFTSCTDHPVARNAAGFYDTMQSYLLSALRGAADGRLLKWDPTTGRTTEMVRDLAYANGVALSSDESWVAVVETNTARVHRHWLRGERKGQTEVLVDKLPGIPDGISRSPDGGFWLALVAPLSPFLRVLGPTRWARQVLSHWISSLLPVLAKPWSGVVRLDSAGIPIDALYDPDGTHVSTLSAATESNGKLFLGNLGGNFVSFVELRR